MNIFFDGFTCNICSKKPSPELENGFPKQLILNLTLHTIPLPLLDKNQSGPIKTDEEVTNHGFISYEKRCKDIIFLCRTTPVMYFLRKNNLVAGCIFQEYRFTQTVLSFYCYDLNFRRYLLM